MSESNPAPSLTGSTAPPMGVKLGSQLSIMMFLQYAIWGAWLPILFPYLMGYRGMPLLEVAIVFMVGAVGAIIAPFIAGQIADRYFNTEKFLGLSHIIGGVLVWQLGWVEGFVPLAVFSLLYSIIYSPTLSLTNSLAFHHLPDRDRDFGRVRMWGTIGWIVVGIGVGQWLLAKHTIDDEEAARGVVATQFADATRRSELLGDTSVTLKDGKALVGPTVRSSDKEIVLTITETNDKGEKEKKETAIARADVEWSGTLYETLAKTEKKDGKEMIDAASSAKILAALTAIDKDGESALKATAEAAGKEGWFNRATLSVPVVFNQQKGMSDAFKISAVLGVIMGVFCFALPKTPPKPGTQKSASAEAIGEIKKQPLLTLFLLAIPISCIHQFYFVHAASFAGIHQAKAEGFVNFVNSIFGVGGGGLMTIGQMSEFFVLALIPLFAKRCSRKTLLAVGIIAYALRMFLFTYIDTIPLPSIVTVMLGIALHGVCFGCFIFVAFMIVDEETTGDVRASAQSLFNLVIVGIGIIVGSLIAIYIVGEWASTPDGMNYTKLFSVPMWASLACLAILLAFYPGGKRQPKHPD